MKRKIRIRLVAVSDIDNTRQKLSKSFLEPFIVYI